MKEPDIEAVILRGLMTDLDYATKYLPHLKESYFSFYGTPPKTPEEYWESFSEEKFGKDDEPRIPGGSLVFHVIKAYVSEFKACPTKEQIIIDIDGMNCPDDQKTKVNLRIIEILDDLAGAPVSLEWLASKTERFIQGKFKHEQILGLIDAETKGRSTTPFTFGIENPPTFQPTKLEGIYNKSPDFMDQLRAWNRRPNTTIPFDIETLNDAVNGVKRKTLNIILAGTNVGKSLMECHFAAMYMKQGLNVLYLTMEMSDELIYNRIYANILDIPLRPDSKLVVPDNVKAPYDLGGLIVRLYPAGMGHAGLFKTYIAELWQQFEFKPDVIFVDYLAICGSERMSGHTVNQQYVVVGSIANELKALAQTTDTVLWTAAQANRPGLQKGTELNLTHFAASVEMTFAADIILALWIDARPELKENYYHCSIEKHQSGGGANKHLMLVVDRAKQRITDTSIAQKKRYEDIEQKLKDLNQKMKRNKTTTFDIDEDA